MGLLRSVSTLLLFAAGCAPAVRTPVVKPADLSTLEARRAQYANDPDRLIEIGTAFYQAREYARARDVFAAVLALRPGDFRAAVQLGLAEEGLNEADSALAAYRRAEGMKASRRAREDLELRILTLTRARLAAEARRVVAEERTLAAAPALPNTIAVLPWTYLGASSELRPLETGLAHLVVTDLSKVSRFTLLERERVQALADELKLTGQGRIEPATAVRSGHLLRAARVVQGAIRETSRDALRLDANVVSTQTAQVEATGSAADRLAELFAMEKTIVLGLIDRMGIVLSPAERRAIAERPTADLQAFLAFSRGLEAEDRGDYVEAARLFREAAARDRGFRAAQDRADQSAAVERASDMTPERLAHDVEEAAGAAAGGVPAAINSAAGTSAGVVHSSSVQASSLQSGLNGVAGSSAARVLQASGAVAVGLRSRLAEALKQDDPVKLGVTGLIHIIIPRP